MYRLLGGSVMTSDSVLYAYRMVPIFDGGGEFYILKWIKLSICISTALRG